VSIGHDLVHRIAGKAEHPEGDHADREENRNGLEGAAEDEGEHAVFSIPPGQGRVVGAKRDRVGWRLNRCRLAFHPTRPP
jgi:hypothetical protein